eukprot:gnl/Carplike_NY0171/4893_a6666_274.p1 GENE.gnl/Carplike_NY0171/4893_a6666_274~~gnl/Carplike_NY0171/4893_a6666_274.p1  ORF type:complete len:630 (+),score=157.33 gnl/Carplike_NY0171/4893_a6666_274:17-1906(+)
MSRDHFSIFSLSDMPHSSIEPHGSFSNPGQTQITSRPLSPNTKVAIDSQIPSSHSPMPSSERDHLEPFFSRITTESSRPQVFSAPPAGRDGPDERGRDRPSSSSVRFTSQGSYQPYSSSHLSHSGPQRYGSEGETGKFFEPHQQHPPSSNVTFDHPYLSHSQSLPSSKLQRIPVHSTSPPSYPGPPQQASQYPPTSFQAMPPGVHPYYVYPGAPPGYFPPSYVPGHTMPPPMMSRGPVQLPPGYAPSYVPGHPVGHPMGHMQAPRHHVPPRSHGASRSLNQFEDIVINTKRGVHLTRMSPIEDIVTHFTSLAKDQNGSRLIQSFLTNPAHIAILFECVHENAMDMVVDPFANYIYQKFLEVSELPKKDMLGRKLRKRILYLSYHVYGCRVVQKALEVVSDAVKIELVQEIRGEVVALMKDQNANHVCQRALELVVPKEVDFMIKAIEADDVVQLSMHPYACRVIQRLLEHGVREQVTPIVLGMKDEAVPLASNSYGNYVVQTAIDQSDIDISLKHEIVEQFTDKAVALSTHKFSSNVIERCIVVGTDEQKRIIIDSIIESLGVLVSDKFGNYCVQRALEYGTPEQKSKLMHLIQSDSSLRIQKYSAHLVRAVEHAMKTGSFPSKPRKGK